MLLTFIKVPFVIKIFVLSKTGFTVHKYCIKIHVAHFLQSCLYPRYEVYRGYIVFAFSVIMFVCLFVCLSVNFFFRQRFLSNYLG